MSPLVDFLAQIQAAIAARDGRFLAELLDPLASDDLVAPLLPELKQGLDNVRKLIKEVFAGSGVDDGNLNNGRNNKGRFDRNSRFRNKYSSNEDDEDNNNDLEKYGDSTMDAIIPLIISFCNYISMEDPLMYFNGLIAIINSSFPSLVVEDWFSPVITCLLRSLTIVGMDHDLLVLEKNSNNSVKNRGSPPKSFNEIHSIVLKVISRLLIAASITSNKDTLSNPPAAILPVTNIALRFYQKIGEIQLSTKILSQRKMKELPLDAYPIPEQVIFHYYSGCHDLALHNFRNAEAHLFFSFIHIPKGDYSHKRQCLIYLIVIRMIRGIFPAKALLEKYNLKDIFDVLLYSTKLGNWAKFELGLKYQCKFFSELGLYYVLLSRMKTIITRNSIKKLYLVKNQIGNNSNNILNMDEITLTLQLSGFSDVNNLNSLSIVISLISHGWIKGYILQGRSLVVLAKKDPFPSMVGI